MTVACKLNLPFHLPFGFHGTFTEKVLLPPAAAASSKL